MAVTGVVAMAITTLHYGDVTMVMPQYGHNSCDTTGVVAMAIIVLYVWRCHTIVLSPWR